MKERIICKCSSSYILTSCYFCPLSFQENFSSSTGIAQRARHPDELKKDGGWMIDIDYYLSQQVC